MLEAVGIAPLFSIADMTIDIVVVLATRRLTHTPISLYMAITLWVLSLLQGLTPQRGQTSLDYVTIVALVLPL